MILSKEPYTKKDGTTCTLVVFPNNGTRKGFKKSLSDCKVIATMTHEELDELKIIGGTDALAIDTATVVRMAQLATSDPIGFMSTISQYPPKVQAMYSKSISEYMKNNFSKAIDPKDNKPMVTASETVTIHELKSKLEETRLK